MKLKQQLGFTLIELLVVISVISLLASVILVSLNTARIRSRDAKRVADLKGVQKALELYLSDFPDFYPVCNQTPSTVCSTTGYQDDLNTLDLVTKGYVQRIPKDPLNTPGSYGYFYARGFRYDAQGNNCPATGKATTYILATRLEDPNSPYKNITQTSNCWDGTPLNYMLSNPN